MASAKRFFSRKIRCFMRNDQELGVIHRLYTIQLYIFTICIYNLNMKRIAELTKEEGKVYDFVAKYVSKHKVSPLISEIAKALDKKSLRSVTQCIEALERKGLIRRDRYKNRNIQLVPDREIGNLNLETVRIPVFASAGCGNLSLLAERIFDEFVDISTNLIKGKDKENIFLIRAQGNSMIDAGINDGDLVLVERIPDQDVEIGDIVVAIVEDNAVIKKYLRSDDIVILNPVSPDKSYRPIIIDGTATYKIFGKVLRTIRIPKAEESRDYQYLPV